MWWHDLFSNWSRNRAFRTRVRDLEETCDDLQAQLTTVKRTVNKCDADVTDVTTQLRSMRGKLTGGKRRATTDTEGEATNGETDLAHIHPKVRGAYKWHLQQRLYKGPPLLTPDSSTSSEMSSE